MDLTRPDAIRSLVESIRSELGRRHPGDQLRRPPPGRFDDADDDSWLAAFELTFLSAVRLIREVLPI